MTKFETCPGTNSDEAVTLLSCTELANFIIQEVNFHSFMSVIRNTSAFRILCSILYIYFITQSKSSIDNTKDKGQRISGEPSDILILHFSMRKPRIACSSPLKAEERSGTMVEVDPTQSLLQTLQILNPPRSSSQEREGGRQTIEDHKTDTIMPESMWVLNSLCSCSYFETL